MSDTEPTETPERPARLDSNGNPVATPRWLTAKPNTRESKASEWCNVFCFIAVAMGLLAFITFGNLFGESSLYSGTSFNAIAGFTGAIFTVIAFLPVIALFSVLRVPQDH